MNWTWLPAGSSMCISPPIGLRPCHRSDRLRCLRRSPLRHVRHSLLRQIRRSLLRRTRRGLLRRTRRSQHRLRPHGPPHRILRSLRRVRGGRGPIVRVTRGAATSSPEVDADRTDSYSCTMVCVAISVSRRETDSVANHRQTMTCFAPDRARSSVGRRPEGLPVRSRVPCAGGTFRRQLRGRDRALLLIVGWNSWILRCLPPSGGQGDAE